MIMRQAFTRISNAWLPIVAGMLLLSVSALAQPADKWINRTYGSIELYEAGNYNAAHKTLKRAVRKHEKKNWLPDVSPVTNILMAQNLDAKGDAQDADALLWSNLLTWESRSQNGELSDTLHYHGHYLIARTLLHFEQSAYALTYLDLAEEALNDSLDPRGSLLQAVRLLRIEVLMQREDWRQADSLIELTFTDQDKRTVRSEMVWNAKKKKNERKRVKGKDYKQRARDLAYLRHLRGVIKLKYGKYELADSMLTENQKTLKIYISPKELTYIQNNLALIELHKDYHYKHDINAARLFRKQRHYYANRMQYRVPNLFYFRVFEEEIQSRLDQEDFADYKDAVNQYKRESVKNFGRKSTHFLHARMLENEGDIYKLRYSKALRKGAKLFEELDTYLPQDHFQRQPYYNQMALLSTKASDYNYAEAMYDKQIALAQKLHGENATVYYRKVLEKAIFLSRTAHDFEEADSLFQVAFTPYVREQLSSTHKDYVRYLNAYGNLFEETDRFDTAMTLYLEGARIAEQRFTISSEEYAQQLIRISNIQLIQGKYLEAETSLEMAVQALKDDKARQSYTFFQALQTLGELYNVNGKYDQAQAVLQRAIRLAKRLDLDASILNISSSEELANVFIKTGRYDDAENILLRTIEVKSGKYGDMNYRLIQPYSDLGGLYLIKGDFVQAEKSTRQALDIARESVSDTALKYVQTLTLLADVYYSMGDYDKALSLYDESIQKTRKKFGENHVSISEILVKKAQVQIAAEYPATRTIAILDTAAMIVTRSINDQHPQYAEAIELKAIVLMNESQFDEALQLLTKASSIYIATYGPKHLKTADNSSLVADLYYLKGDYEPALTYYDQALSSYQRIFNKEHPKYAGTLSNLGKTHYAKGSYRDAMRYLDQTTAIYLNYIRQYFPALSENEKAKYWNKIRPDFELYNSLAINYYQERPELLERMYTNKLATKALLLNSSIKIKERIMNNGDEQLIARYEEWGSKREQLTQALSMTVEEQRLNNLNPKQLQRDINLLEKELSESTEGFAESVKQDVIDWKDVQASLYTNEAAIELIQFNYFTDRFTDSIIYAALIVTEETRKQPELVVLSNGNDLEGKFFRYYRNSIKLKTKDKYSYGKFWSAIDAKIEGKQNIYLSADGIYNQLNPETFRMDDGTFLIDRYNFFLVSNTKELALYDHEEEPTTLSMNDAVLIGNPQFSEGGASSDEEVPENKVSSVEPLPGAEKEVKDVSVYLSGNDWDTETYLLAQATEDRVKAVNNPRIFHVATHGFFMQEEQVANQDLLALEERPVENPLLKSGLLFTGADELLAENNVYQFNRKDGILTAYEAMNLKLDNTELVVLSACETGLGEIKSGEGVYGLQRSFLVAGAQNVIMTLFKVNDQVTQELMNTFYRKWLETGNKRAAFLYAKREIKKQYDSPIYWGSFVMIGLD